MLEGRPFRSAGQQWPCVHHGAPGACGVVSAPWMLSQDQRAGRQKRKAEF